MPMGGPIQRLLLCYGGPSPTTPHSGTLCAYGVFSVSGICAIHMSTDRSTATRYLRTLEDALQPATKNICYHWIYLVSRSSIHTSRMSQIARRLCVTACHTWAVATQLP